MGYLPATVFTIGVLAITILGCWLCLKADAIVSWFKGSRILYALRHNSLYRCEWGDMNWASNIVEVIQKPFCRCRILIHGTAKNWRITQNLVTKHGIYVCLEQCNLGLPLEEAFQVINTYPSFWAMLDKIKKQEIQIAELESRPTQLELQAAKDNLFLANKQRQDWHAGTIAILRLIDGDKQRYRSQAAKNIRENLEYLRQCQWDYNESRPSDEIISMWLDKLSKPEARVVR